MKNVTIPMNVVLPVTDELILKLLTAKTVNSRVFRYMEEENGEATLLICGLIITSHMPMW